MFLIELHYNQYISGPRGSSQCGVSSGTVFFNFRRKPETVSQDAHPA